MHKGSRKLNDKKRNLKRLKQRKRRTYPRQVYGRCYGHSLAREQLTIYDIEPVPPKDETPYQEQYARFLLTERGLKPASVKNNINALRQFIRFLQQEYGIKTFQPQAVTTSHIRRYLAYLKNQRGNSPSTRNTKLAALGSYYNFLESCGYQDEDDNPLQLISRAKVPKRLPVYLTLEEAKKLLESATAGPTPCQDNAILRVLLQTGLRASELTALRVCDVDLPQKCLLIQGKDNRQRLVPLTENTAAALQAYLELRTPVQDPAEAVFLNSSESPLRSPALNSWFKKLCSRAGVTKPGLTVRNLRHTCLTLLLQEGAPLMSLKELAGHKTVRTTQRYLHVTQNQLRKAMEKHPLG